MHEGNYMMFLKNPSSYIVNFNNLILNYVGPIEIKMSKDKGRGLFAKQDIKQGALLIVEQAVSFGSQHVDATGYSFSGYKEDLYDVHDIAHVDQLCRLSNLTSLGGVEAARVSTLFDGSEASCQEIPPIELFVNRDYDKEQVPYLSADKLQKIIKYNTFSEKREERKVDTLYCLKSYLNHGRPSVVNLAVNEPHPNVNLIYASIDIKEGEELLIDYAVGVEKQEERDEKLEKYGIKEEKEEAKIEEVKIEEIKDEEEAKVSLVEEVEENSEEAEKDDEAKKEE